jgi:hypothetical protein
MTLTYDHSPGRVLMLEDGQPFFDTDAYPVMLSDTTELTGLTISFPDLDKGIGYGFARGLSGSDMYRSCISTITMGPQEWGPSNMKPAADAPGHVLAETVIATVPGACDGLLVQFNLTRTSAPSQINGNTIPTLFETGAWVMAPGGSLPTEFLAPVSRQIDVVLQTDADGAPVFNLDGTRNVVLQRRQSVTRKYYGFYRTDTMNSGWTAHGTPGRYGHIVYPIQQKGPTFTVGTGTDYAYGESNACVTTDPTNYGSVYQGDIRITPLFLNEPPENSGATTKTGFFAGHEVMYDAARKTAWTVPAIPAGAEHATRYAYVMVTASDSATRSTSIAGITVNGVTATPLVSSFGNDNVIWWALFYAHVPTGEELNIQVNLSGNSVSALYVCAHVAYNLSNPTSPSLTNSNFMSTNSSPNINITTTAGAICLFSASFRTNFTSGTGSNDPRFRGADLQEDYISIVSGAALSGWAATHIAPSTSLGIKALTDTSSSGSSNAALSQFRWFGIVLT